MAWLCPAMRRTGIRNGTVTHPLHHLAGTVEYGGESAAGFRPAGFHSPIPIHYTALPFQIDDLQTV